MQKEENPTVEENHRNILSTFIDDNLPDVKASIAPEKVEQISSSKCDNKWITSGRGKCKSKKRENEIWGNKVIYLEYFFGLLEEEQCNYSKLFTSPTEWAGITNQQAEMINST